MDRRQLISQVRAAEELERRKIIKRCEADPWHWLTLHTETFDTHAESKEVEVYKPFPQKSYLKTILEIFNDRKEKRIFVPKSREMMLSWLACGFITWSCQFKPHTQWVIQSKDEGTAGKLLKYCKCLYVRQPQWMKERYPLHGGKFDTDGGRQSLLLQLWQSESSIEGIPSGADKARQMHPSGFFFDEAAYIGEFEAAYASVDNVTPKIIAVSSAIPGGYFAQIAAPVESLG